MATQRRRSTKGTRSKTHPGRKNYTTKKGDKVFHRKGKYVRKSRKPYSKKKRGGRLAQTGRPGPGGLLTTARDLRSGDPWLRSFDFAALGTTRAY